MNVLIFGAKGYLGQKFLELYPNAATPSVDIADASAVGAALDEHQPDVVINCAGKTGRPNIDWCEDHREETIRANVTGPLVILDECAKRNVYWVHVGSGCVYQGDNGGKGFTEDDPSNFHGSFYSRTKTWCDDILKEFPVLLLRLRMPFDDTAHERSLISKITKYPRVLDVDNSLTYLPDFFAAAQALIEQRAIGVYNVVNPGAMSPYKIMVKYQQIVDPNHSFEVLSVDDLSDVAKAGRSNCLLSITKLENMGISMRPVDEAVVIALEQIAKLR